MTENTTSCDGRCYLADGYRGASDAGLLLALRRMSAATFCMITMRDALPCHLHSSADSSFQVHDPHVAFPCCQCEEQPLTVGSEALAAEAVLRIFREDDT